jgi:predicted DNA-binding WGR domain protein
MLTYKWLNRAKDRFYQIVVIKNEAHGMVLNYHWGSCNTNRGGKKEISVCSQEEAQKTIDKLMKRRKARGYELIINAYNQA